VGKNAGQNSEQPAPRPAVETARRDVRIKYTTASRSVKGVFEVDRDSIRFTRGVLRRPGCPPPPAQILRPFRSICGTGLAPPQCAVRRTRHQTLRRASIPRAGSPSLFITSVRSLSALRTAVIPKSEIERFLKETTGSMY